MKITTSRLSCRKQDKSSVFFNSGLFIPAAVLFVLMIWVGYSFYSLGIHTQIKYILQGRFTEMTDGALKDALIEIKDSVHSETSAYVSNNLSTLYLDIPFENIQIIQQKRDDAVRTGILLSSDADFVSAEIRYNDSASINVKIRLKGDWTDHLTGNKWSYRINVLDDTAVEGMRKFSIQAPETRDYAYEWAYHEHLMRAGILAPRYSFVNVVINGEYKGIYAMEESFSTELMESQGRRSGVLLRYDENDLWQNWAVFFGNGKEDMRTLSDESGYFMMSGLESANVSPFASGTIVDNPVLLEEYKTAQSLLRQYQTGQVDASQVFDLDCTGKYLAISELWGAIHGMAWHNIRFYYNPVTGLLEPIGYDGIPMSPPYSSMGLYDTFNANDSYGTDFLLEDPDIQKAFYQAARTLFSETEYQNIQAALVPQTAVYEGAMDEEYTYFVQIDWAMLEQRWQKLEQELTLSTPFRGYAVYHPEGYFPFAITIEDTDRMMFPIKIESIIGMDSDSSYFVEMQSVQTGTDAIHSDRAIYVKNPGDTADLARIDLLRMKVYIDGDKTNSTFIDIPVVQIPDEIIHEPEEEEQTKQLPSGQLVYAAGKWQIDEMIVIHEDERLLIQPGAELDFASQAGIINYGSLQIVGTDEQPVVLQGINGNAWAGILLKGQRAQNRMAYVSISQGNSISNQQGLVEIVDTSATLDHVHIAQARGTGLRVVQSALIAEALWMDRIAGTALDASLSQLQMTNCAFFDVQIGGKFTASRVDIEGGEIAAVKSAIEAHDASTVTLNYTEILSQNVGLIASGLSKINLVQSTIESTGKVCMVAYSNTENQYSRIALSDVDLSNCSGRIFRTDMDEIRGGTMDSPIESIIKPSYDILQMIQ